VILLNEVLRLERPIIGLDLETTGTNAQTARIVELGLEIYKPDGTVKEWRTYINPTIPIPPGATAKHHITDAMVQDAPTFARYAAEPAFVKGLTGCDFAGYNVRFDLNILAAEFRRAGVLWSFDGARILDGLRIWQIAEPRSLSDAAKSEGIELTDAHSALADVKASTRFIAARLRRHANFPRDLDKLHAELWPGWFDTDGKLKWRDGELCITFGEHRDKSLRQVPRSYLEWILKKDFSPLVKDTCRNALKGVYHAAPVTDEDPDSE